MAGTPVMLLHGLWFGPSSTWLLGRRLKAAGFEPHYFGYPTLRRDLATNARGLAQRLAGFPAGTPVHLVGHSLGGLVILRMLDEHRAPPGRVVLMGSPVRGSRVARRLSRRGWTGIALGRNRSDLGRGFATVPAGREVGVIAGTLGVGAGRLFPDLDQPGDGTVAVAEARPDGPHAFLDLPVSHTGLVVSRRVARAVAAFLDSGCFGESPG